MNNKEAIKVLKRMLTPDLEADEFAAIQKAIKSLEMIEKWQRKVKEMCEFLEERKMK